MSAEEEFDRWVTWPEWAKDAIVTDVTVTFSWRDRLRILCGKRPVVTVKTFTRMVIGEQATQSRVYVPRLWYRRRGLVAIAESPDTGSVPK
jgi:hypothetical protein